MARLGSSRHPAVILGAVLLIASAACTEPRSELAALADTPDATRPGVETAPAPPESDLYLIDPQTGAAEVLLRAPGAQTNAELSPDGERVVYESWLDHTAQIFVLERDGTPRVPLPRVQCLVSLRLPVGTSNFATARAREPVRLGSVYRIIIPAASSSGLERS